MDEVAMKMAAAIAAVRAMLDAMKAAEADPRSLATARTQIETGFLWAANAVGGDPIL